MTVTLLMATAAAQFVRLRWATDASMAVLTHLQHAYMSAFLSSLPSQKSKETHSSIKASFTSRSTRLSSASTRWIWHSTSNFHVMLHTQYFRLITTLKELSHWRLTTRQISRGCHATSLSPSTAGSSEVITSLFRSMLFLRPYLCWYSSIKTN